MKRKNAKIGPQLNRNTNKTVKKPLTKSIDKKWLLIGAAVLVAVIVFTTGLVWFYGDTAVARINGIRILGSEVSRELAANTDIQEMMAAGLLTQREAREVAAREVAFIKLFEDYAGRNDIYLQGDESSWQIVQAVVGAIVADPSQFANFEAYMPEDEIPAAEAHAAEILERALAGEDFDALVAAYSDDGMPPEGYAFTQGAMVPEFCEAARNLEIGEISGLVQTQFGFHIIKRIEPPEDVYIMIPGAQVPPPLETDDELFGAKHILIAATARSVEARMSQAVPMGFETKFNDANLVFLRGLNNI